MKMDDLKKELRFRRQLCKLDSMFLQHRVQLLRVPEPFLFFRQACRQLMLLVLLVLLADLLQVRLLHSSSRTTKSMTSTIYDVKLQKFKPPMAMKTFVNRFEQYCLTQKIEISDKANLIIHVLDDSTFSVIQRELTDVERTNYDTVKVYLLKCFDIHKEIGQKRLLFRQAKREGAQTLEEFYTHLLGKNDCSLDKQSVRELRRWRNSIRICWDQQQKPSRRKGFCCQSQQMRVEFQTPDTVDRMIIDQCIVGCEVDRTRLHLIEKGPRTSREVLTFGIAHQARSYAI